MGAVVLLLATGPAQALIGTAYQMQLGNPSNATADTNNHDHHLIQRTVQALDYSDNLREPNWASWDLTASDLGSSGRNSSFYTDSTLPPNFYWVKTTDYSGSGYDRGHMCPSADRTDSTTNNKLVFYMSNIVPQTPDNNRDVWASLEDYCRTLAEAGDELLITCGPSGFDGSRIDASGQVYIPGYVWKIIVVVSPGSGMAVNRIDSSTRVIAVNIPNIAGIRSDPWTNYLTCVNQIQANTGFTFFSALSADVATVLRAKVDGAPVEGITGFAPMTGTANTCVVINGTNFATASTVTFNGMPAPCTVNSSNQITAFVPADATTGPIGVVGAGGLATSVSNFTVTGSTPLLSIASTSSNSLVISWPSQATSYVLQQNSNPGTANWEDVTNEVSVMGAANRVIVSPATGACFFRLYQP